MKKLLLFLSLLLLAGIFSPTKVFATTSYMSVDFYENNSGDTDWGVIWQFYYDTPSPACNKNVCHHETTVRHTWSSYSADTSDSFSGAEYNFRVHWATECLDPQAYNTSNNCDHTYTTCHPGWNINVTWGRYGLGDKAGNIGHNNNEIYSDTSNCPTAPPPNCNPSNCNSGAFCGANSNVCTHFGPKHCVNNVCVRDSATNSDLCCGTNGCTCTPSPTKDLIVSGFRFPDGSPNQSLPPDLVKIKNRGNTKIVGSFKVLVESRSNHTGDSDKEPIYADMAPGQERDITSLFKSIQLPDHDGTFTALATVDSDNDINESNENNNTLTDDYTVSSTATKDLTVSLSWPDGIAGQIVNPKPNVTITNRGTADITGSFVVRVEDGNGFHQAPTINADMAAGQTRDITSSFSDWTFPPAGHYTATADVDHGDTIAESNENNNTTTSDYVVTEPSSTQDLTISLDCTDGFEGGTLDPHVTITNLGTAAITDSFVVRVDNGNGSHLSPTITDGMAAGETRDISSDFNDWDLPPAGNYTANADVDHLDDINESNEDNNTATCNYTVSPAPLSSITVRVYNDPNGDSTGTNLYKGNGASVTFTGNGEGGPYPIVNGSYVKTGLSSGDSSILLTLPPGYDLSTTSLNPNPYIYVPPDQVVNFYIQAKPPDCKLTASPSTVNPGTPSNLTTDCTSPTGDALTYNWADDTRAWGGSIRNIGTNHTSSAVWDSPYPWWTPQTAYPSVSVCYVTDPTLCTGIQASINIVPLFNVTGNVFVDVDKNGYKCNGGTDPTGSCTTESNYTRGKTTVTISGGGTSNTGDGTFNFTNLPAGQYTVTYTNKPNGYNMTYPIGAGNPHFTVTVGTTAPNLCNTNEGRNPADSTCSNGNISNLNFGINNAIPWIQSGGSDLWFNNGFTDQLPDDGAVCGAKNSGYMSTKVNGTPGVIFSGPNDPDFGNGQASQNGFNWQVGGIPGGSGNWPEDYSAPIRTSYTYISGLLRKFNDTATDITTVGGCTNSGGNTTCNTNNAAWHPLAHTIYVANGNLTLMTTNSTPSYTFPDSKDYIFLVAGNLTISEEIHVPGDQTTDTGSTVLFTAAGSIIIDSSVGTDTIADYTPNIEGWYSADHDFTVEGASTCPATPDKKLNVAGAIVVNAAKGGGVFDNQRDLCQGDLTCPAFYIQERPDFTLNAPAFLQIAPRIYQEVAP